MDQGCQSVLPKETGRGWVVALVRWVPTLQETGEAWVEVVGTLVNHEPLLFVTGSLLLTAPHTVFTQDGPKHPRNVLLSSSH